MAENRFEMFTITLSQILKNIQKIKSEKMARFDLKSSHALCIYQLSKSAAGLSAAQLSENGGVDKALISRIISELYEKGYIEPAYSNEKKKYGMKFVLTESGRLISKEIDRISGEIQSAVSSNIPPEELSIFYKTLFSLSENFKIIVKNTDA